jgi:hypothetical protein
MPVLGANLHLFETVANIRVAEFVQASGGRIVWFDRDQGHALIAIIIRQLFDARLIELRCGAVVTREDDGEDFGRGILGERVRLAVDTRQRKIRRLGADGRQTPFLYSFTEVLKNTGSIFWKGRPKGLPSPEKAPQNVGPSALIRW